VASSEPNFFVLGAARSGTTALAEMLRQHPDAFVTRPKEPHFLAFANRAVAFTGPGDDVTINRVAVTDIEAYRALYDGAAGKAARGDASVSSLYYADDAVATLTQHFPDARLVVILRDPVARAFSAYSYLRVRGYEPCEAFADALALEEERRKRGWHHLYHYAGMGRYARQLRVFTDAFPGDRIKVLFYEAMEADPAGTARDLFAFLGINPTAEVSHERVNVSGSPRSPFAQRAIQWGARRQVLKSALKKVAPFGVRERIRRANLTQSAAPPSEAALLRDRFALDNDALRGLLEQHFPALAASAPTWIPRVVERVS
jgi:Sulfotransferase family